jgi:hypothetical protein
LSLERDKKLGTIVNDLVEIFAFHSDITNGVEDLLAFVMDNENEE